MNPGEHYSETPQTSVPASSISNKILIAILVLLFIAAASFVAGSYLLGGLAAAFISAGFALCVFCLICAAVANNAGWINLP